MITGEVLIKFFQACKNGKYLIQLHSVAIKTGFLHHSLFAAKLIDLYSRFTTLQLARQLFDETPNPTPCIWNRILSCYCREKRYIESLFLFSRFSSSERPSLYTIQIALKACAGLKELDFGNAIHAFVRKRDVIDRNLFVGSSLIELYSKCGRMDDATRVFEEYAEPDTVLWTTIITGYEQNGKPVQGLELFAKMANVKEVELDPIVLVSVVSACAKLLDLKSGKSVHGYMIRVGWEKSLSLVNALLNLYGKTGSVNAASNLFVKMEVQDVISWGSMIACHAHHGSPEAALDLFNEMVVRGIEPNVVVLFSALQACEATCNLQEGSRIHKLAVRIGLDVNVLVSTALIDMYMNCCSPDEAIEVFEWMPEKDAVCYSTVMLGCVQNGKAHKAIDIFCHMLSNNLQPSGFDLIHILTACSELGILQQTSCIHGFAIKVGVDDNMFFCASLIESYAKCGSLDGSVAVFRAISNRDVVIWSSMLAAYGYHGKGREALGLFDHMINHSSVRPNGVSFLSILSACSHAGLVKEGIEMFNVMVKDYHLPPSSKHYAVVVDLLGRVGQLDMALAFINRMPQPVEANVWGAFLVACRIHQKAEMAEIAAKNLLESSDSEAGYYVLLSNIYAADERWSDVNEVREFVEEKQLNKASGRSSVGIRDEVCTFMANDKSHEEFKKIYELLISLQGVMKRGV